MTPSPRDRHVRALLVSFALTALAAPALAQNRAGDEDALIQHGVELRQQGNDDAALVEFRRAYDIAHSPRALAQVALAEQAVGHWVDAETHLEQALTSTSDPWIAHNEAALRQALGIISHHVGVLDVRANVSRAELWIDGARVATLPTDPPPHVVAGTVEFEVRAPGYITVRRTIDVMGGVRAREDVQLLPSQPEAPVAPSTAPVATPVAAAPAASHPADTHDEGTAPSPLPIVVTGVGVVALGASAVFYGLRANAIGNCTQSGDTLVCPTQSDAQRAQQGGTFTIAGNVLVISGAVVTAVGVAWLLVDRLGRHHHEATRAQLGIAPTPGGFAIGVGGRF